MAQAHDYDALVLDVMLPGHRRLRGLPAAARGGRLDAGADADRARLGRRSRRRARRRRRRLPRQAVRVRRAAGAAARAGPPRRPRAAATVLEVGDLRLDPATREVDAATTPIRFPRRSSRCSRRSCAGRARCSRAATCSSTPGTSPTRTARTSSTSTSAAARKIDEPFGRHSLETVRGGGYRLRDGTVPMSRLPIRLRVTAAFAVAMAVVLPARACSSTCASASHLAAALDRDLRLRAQDLAALVGRAGMRSLDGDSAAGSSSAARATRSCSRRRARARRHAAARRRPLLSPPSCVRPSADRSTRQAAVPGLDEPSRLLATAVVAQRPAGSCSSSARRARTAPRRWRASATSC